MRFLTQQESEAWWNTEFQPPFLSKLGLLRRRFWIRDADSESKTILARVIAHQLLHTEGQVCLVQLTEWGVWPNAECLPLAMQFRKALGTTEPLMSLPGHLFDDSERDLLFALLAQVHYFSWGCRCCCPQLGWAVVFSHDDYFDVIIARRHAADELIRELEGVGFSSE
jgi:hypothetical protein